MPRAQRETWRSVHRFSSAWLLERHRSAGATAQGAGAERESAELDLLVQRATAHVERRAREEAQQAKDAAAAVARAALLRADGSGITPERVALLPRGLAATVLELGQVLTRLQEQVEAMGRGASALTFDATAAVAALPVLASLTARLQSAQLGLLGSAQAAGAQHAASLRSMADVVAHACSMDRRAAVADASLAAGLRDTPVLARALAEGLIHPAQAAPISAVLAKARRHGLADSVLAAGEQVLTGFAVGTPDDVDLESGEILPATPGLAPAALARAARNWWETVRPQEREDKDRADQESRAAYLSPTLQGRFDLRGTLTGEAGVTLSAALASAMAGLQGELEPGTRVPAPQLRHDALVALAQAWLARPDAPSVAGQRPQVFATMDVRDLLAVDGRAFTDWVPSCSCMLPPSLGGEGRVTCACDEPCHPLTDPDALRGLLSRRRPALCSVDGARSPITAAAAWRIAGDSDIRRVLLAGSVPLDLGRRVRLASPDQRKASYLRDGASCAISGCHAPAHWSRLHHQLFWRDGGPTDLDNLPALCTHHHDLAHQGWLLVGSPSTGLRLIHPDLAVSVRGKPPHQPDLL